MKKSLHIFFLILISIVSLIWTLYNIYHRPTPYYFAVDENGHVVFGAFVPSILSKTNVLQVIYTLSGTNKNCMIEPVEGGLSESTLYKVTSNDKHYLIKLIEHRSMEEKLREINAQKIASEQGQGPTVYASDVNEGWIIMDYVEVT